MYELQRINSLKYDVCVSNIEVQVSFVTEDLP
jgi:hypothetical protein